MIDLYNTTNTTTETMTAWLIYDVNAPLSMQQCQEYCLNAAVVNVHNKIIVFFFVNFLLWVLLAFSWKYKEHLPKEMIPFVLDFGWLFLLAFSIIVYYVL